MPQQNNENGDNDKPVEVNKWDGNAVKNALDDAVRTVIQDKFSYTERTRLVDTRLLISALSVGLALFALLWDWLNPYPKSRSILILCVLSYFFLMGILQMYAWFVEGSVFYMARDEDPTGKNKDTLWSFSSKLKRFEHMYTLEVSRAGGGGDKGEAKLEKSIAQWFDEAGVLDHEKFNADVLKIHDSLLSSKKKK